MDYLPGNFSAFYGGVVGGVVDVKSRNPKTDGFHGVLEVNAYNANVVLETPITDTLSIAGAYRRSYIDLILPLFLKDDSPSFTVAPRYDDAQLKLTWKPNAEEHLPAPRAAQPGRAGARDPQLVLRGSDLGRDFRNETGFNQLRLRHTYVDGAWRVDTIGGFDRTDVDLNIGGQRGLTLGASTWAMRSTTELRASPSGSSRRWHRLDLYQRHVPAALRQPPREGEPPVLRPDGAGALRELAVLGEPARVVGRAAAQAGAATPHHPRRPGGPGQHPLAADAPRHRRPAAGDPLDRAADP